MSAMFDSSVYMLPSLRNVPPPRFQSAQPLFPLVILPQSPASIGTSGSQLAYFWLARKRRSTYMRSGPAMAWVWVIVYFKKNGGVYIAVTQSTPHFLMPLMLASRIAELCEIPLNCDGAVSKFIGDE